ncbi:MAG TPA: DUF1553 domain-containing protein, partial [Pirellulales bacterium]|nr:DUF1553 domain-containing protein [Pirellulales bacterium]
FNAFDSPSGEACVARREVSNTPLQALTLMNDTVYWEAAQALGAALAGKSAAASTEERIAELVRRCLVRPPGPDEVRLLSEFYATQRQRFATSELDAKAVAGEGEGEGEGDVVDRAAWTIVSRAVLNLDETITKN